MIVAVDDDGCFIEKIADFSGCYVKDADKDIIEAIKVGLLCFHMDKNIELILRLISSCRGTHISLSRSSAKVIWSCF